MSFFSILKLAFFTLGRNKLRSFLTALGVILAVSSVITMVGLVDGANISVQAEISKLGTNMIMIIPGSSKSGGQNMGMGSLTSLKEEDSEEIFQECPSARWVSPWVRTGSQVVYAGQNWFTAIIGTNEEFLNIRDWSLACGANFTRHDNTSAAKVCLLGKTVADKLFGSINPMGKTIRVRKKPFLVLGVLAEKGQTGIAEDQDDRIVAPFFTVQRELMGITHANMILVSATSDDDVEKAKTEIEEVLRRRHRLTDDQESDFALNTQADFAAMARSTMQILEIFLSCVASISLLVGGINIMNMMLISVTERTREIGIRMAVGARSRDILTQFLVEAMVLSSIGAWIGILFGIGLTRIISQSLTGWETTISVPAILISVLVSAAVGVFFGLYPAWIASQKDPIEALSYE